MGSADQPGTLPPPLETELGYSLKGWAHLTGVLSRRLPTNLHRANLLRRGATQLLYHAARRGR